jgi:hypothetical protein
VLYFYRQRSSANDEVKRKERYVSSRGDTYSLEHTPEHGELEDVQGRPVDLLRIDNEFKQLALEVF